jgi:hypothetical protein
MDLDRAQEDCALGRFPHEQLPELGAQMMMQGHDGPAILELASFHRPGRWDVPDRLVEQAFREAGFPSLSRVEAGLRFAERLIEACLREEVEIDRLAGELSTLSIGNGELIDSPLGPCFWTAFELTEYNDCSCLPESAVHDLRRSLIQEAGRFLAARRSPPASSP